MSARAALTLLRAFRYTRSYCTLRHRRSAFGFLARAYRTDFTGDIVIAGDHVLRGMKSPDGTNVNLTGASRSAGGAQVVGAEKPSFNLRTLV